MKTIIKIYKEIYKFPKSKEVLREILNAKTTKTVENYVLKYNNIALDNEKEIIYDKALRKYRFNKALPSFIPSFAIYNFFGESINNTYLKDDFLDILNYCDNDDNSREILIETKTLSPLLQTIIQIRLVLNYNMSIKINYLSSKGEEVKYIKPHYLNSKGYTHYLYASYHKDNNKDVGEMRTFALNGIKSIEFHHIENETLEKKLIGNAWGVFDKHIILHISGFASHYFRRENIFNDDQFDLISLESDNSLIVKMHYKDDKDIINLMQKWMPHITIYKHSKQYDNIYKEIVYNYHKLLNK